MSETSLLHEVQKLKAEWDGLQPLKPEDEERLWQKFRLEWNFNSNHIEGNTLTYGETELLIMHDQTTGDHALREYEEMKAHDLAIHHVRKLARDARDLSEADIRELNRIILKEPFWKEAITADGRPTRKQIVPGEYKTAPNNVRTATGELFRFEDPINVPIRMQELVGWLRNALKETKPQLDLLAAKAHHEFVLIHPFDDGNGRVARLLMNYAVLRLGYLPVIIKSADKKNYLAALRKADAGDREPFSAYLLQQLKWSLELGIKAAKGESIEEVSDVEKQIALLAQNEAGKTARIQKRSWEKLDYLFDQCWKPLFEKFEGKTENLRALFFSSRFVIHADTGSQGSDWRSQLEYILKQRQQMPRQVSMYLQMEGYAGTAPRPFNLALNLEIQLSDYEYQIRSGQQCVFKKLYSEMLLSDERDRIIQSALKQALENIQEMTSPKE